MTPHISHRYLYPHYRCIVLPERNALPTKPPTPQHNGQASKETSQDIDQILNQLISLIGQLRNAVNRTHLDSEARQHADKYPQLIARINEYERKEREDDRGTRLGLIRDIINQLETGDIAQFTALVEIREAIS